MDTTLPPGAVGGLAEILGALGDELREANRQIGERKWMDQVEPVLLFDQATVELSATATITGSGGLKFWVLSGGVDHANQKSIRITVHLNGPDGGLEAGA